MIPKIIHFIWFNDPDKGLSEFEINRIQNKEMLSNVGTWPMILKDYIFMYWNNSHINLWMDSPLFKYWWEQKNYAFCSDYVRAWALYNYGGIYLDTDVSIYFDFERILHLKTFYGLECVTTTIEDKYAIYNDKNEKHAFTSAIMACEKHDNLQYDYINLLNKYYDKYDYSLFTMHEYGYLLNTKYNYKVVNSISDAKECENQNILPIFNSPRFDRWYEGTDEQNYGICDHKFFNSWIKDTNDDIFLGKIKLDKIFTIHMASNKQRRKIIESNKPLLNNIEIYYTCRKPFLNKIVNELPNDFLKWPYHDNIEEYDKKVNTALLDLTTNIYNIVKTSYELDYENIMIMEDDVKIKISKEELNDIFNNVPNDFDILQVRPFVNKIDDLPLWYDNKLSKDTWGDQMFILNRRGMKYFIDFYDNNMKAGDSPFMFFQENNNDNYKYYILNKNILDVNGESLINN